MTLDRVRHCLAGQTADAREQPPVRVLTEDEVCEYLWTGRRSVGRCLVGRLAPILCADCTARGKERLKVSLADPFRLYLLGVPAVLASLAHNLILGCMASREGEVERTGLLVSIASAILSESLYDWGHVGRLALNLWVESTAWGKEGLMVWAVSLLSCSIVSIFWGF